MSIHISKAIVVGASSGIGEAIARQLAQSGAMVAIAQSVRTGQPVALADVSGAV